QGLGLRRAHGHDRLRRGRQRAGPPRRLRGLTMALLYVIVIGTALGIGARYAFWHRDLTGILLLPLTGTAASAAIWVLLTVLGWSRTSGWIWLVTVVATALIVAITAIVLPRTRAHADDSRYAALTNAR